jgi:hypothetical protein
MDNLNKTTRRLLLISSISWFVFGGFFAVMVILFEDDKSRFVLYLSAIAIISIGMGHNLWKAISK